ncbi:MAG: hypothetical protein MSG64_08150 [Pyrinomonadaceae bacterium MAG19_C2-C3]|nr:hypothetical protein [Pyrinomonadaceae bacterium MAG19_C2-C3]
MTLAVRFNARERIKIPVVASATIETGSPYIQPSLTRRQFYFDAFRALKRTAKVTLSLRDDLCTGFSYNRASPEIFTEILLMTHLTRFWFSAAFTRLCGEAATSHAILSRGQTA